MIAKLIQPLPYREIWGAVAGSNWYSTWGIPLTQFKVDHDLVELNMWFKKYSFAPGQIVDLKLFVYFGKYVQIIHNREDYPKFIAVCSLYNIKFWKDMFNQAGFNLPQDN